MKILLLTSAFDGLAQRLYVELAALGHEIAVEFDGDDAIVAEAVSRAGPDLVIAAFLRRSIPASVFSSVRCFVVHPGLCGDGGPAALDWAILEGAREWGVTVRQPDAGPVWATRCFPMRLAPKSSLYRRETTEAAAQAVLEAVEKLAYGEDPAREAKGEFDAGRTAFLPERLAERAIDWARDDTQSVLRKIHAADGFPGVRDTILGHEVHLYGAHRGTEDALSLRGERGCASVAGSVLATRDGAILRGTTDGAVWITHLQAVPGGAESARKLPAAQVLGDALAGVPEAAFAIDAPVTVPTWREIRYEEHGEVGVLHFAFNNGAMSTTQCRRLVSAIRHARSRPSKVLVLAGGPDYWSNGIDLNAIETAAQPADALWENLNALDDVACEIVNITDRLTVSAIAGSASAGGVFLALAADRVWLSRSVVLNPHYRGIGNIFGSEYRTYLLPRRVGEGRAKEIREWHLPMGSQQAVATGLADARFAHDAEAFLNAAIKRAQAMARDPRHGERLFAKRRQRFLDESAKPLERYREEELAQLKRDFLGGDPRYHEARQRFAGKRSKEASPRDGVAHRETGGNDAAMLKRPAA